MAKQTFKYNSRKFLNKKSGLAAIECSVEKWGFGSGIDTSVQISDCNRSVNLDFSVFSLSELPVMYQKLTLLQEEIGKLHSYLTENYEAMATELKEAEAKRKGRKKKNKAVQVDLDELQ